MTKKLKLDIETLEERIAPTFPCTGHDPQPDVISVDAGSGSGATVTFCGLGPDVTIPNVFVTHP